MKSNRRRGLLLILALLVLGWVIVSPAIRAADASTPRSEEVSQLLSQAKKEALELEHDALEMETFGRSRVSWMSHARQLDLVKEHINKTGKLLSKLNALRDAAAPWQQKAIDQIEPLLKQLAANTTAAINHIGDNRNDFHEDYYKGYLLANYETADKLAALIRDYVDYEEAMEKLEALNRRLSSVEN